MDQIGTPQEDIAALAQLSADDRATAERIAADLDPSDANALLEFAVEAQQELAALADPILNKVTAKDAGPVGETLQDLMIQIREVNASGVTPKAGLFGRMPGVAKTQQEVHKLLDRYEKVGRKIERIVENLREQRQLLLTDINWLDQLYDRNARSHRDLLIHIAAGEIKLAELRRRQGELLATPDAAGNSTSFPRAQQVSDLSDTIVGLERRVYDLKLTAMVALQAAPQIRLVQAGDKALVEKIQSSILTTIPLWKNAISLAIAMANQGRALAIQRAVTDTTNELLTRNAAMLRQGMTTVAQENERGVIDLETLVKVNDQLVQTIEETIRIQHDGYRRRREAEVELQKMHGQLAKALTTARPAPQLEPGQLS